MLAVIFSIGLFIFWAGVGYSIVGSREPNRFLQRILLAPAVGMAATLIPTHLLNRAGIPIGVFGPYLSLALAAFAGIRCYFARPSMPWREHSSVAGLLLLGFVMTGWPMFEFGFDWLSYCNDDMASYCLLAQRVLHHGHYDVPTEQELGSMADASQYYWFMDVAAAVRPGPETMLAWATSLTGLTPQHAFMPLILSLHLTLLSATGALTASFDKSRQAVAWTLAVASFSAIMTFGTVYQLLGQMVGVPLVVACVCLTFVLLSPLSVQERRGTYAFASITGVALLLAYPEITPFLGCGYLFYIVATWRSFGSELRSRSWLLATACISACLVLNTNILTPFAFLEAQSVSAFGNSADEVFPAFRTPSGLLQFWGMRTLSAPAREPWTSIGIVVGAAVLLGAAWLVAKLMRRANPASLVVAVMASVGVLLFVQGSGFGLYKLAMYVQPFLLSVLATGYVTFLTPTRARWGLVGLVLLGVAGQFKYVRASRGSGGGAFVELGSPSSGRLITELQQYASKSRGPVVLDAHNIVLFKLAALHFRSRPGYYSGCQLDNVAGFAGHPRDSIIREDSLRLSRWYGQQFRSNLFALHDHDETLVEFTTFELGRGSLASPEATLFASTWRNSSFNRWHLGNLECALVPIPLSRVQNFLLFQPSMLGDHYYSPRGPIALYQNENDPFFKGDRMAGIGRFLLFEVLKPSESTRVQLELTATVTTRDDRRLPSATAIGAGRGDFSVVGSGAARLISPPLETQEIAGRHYVAIDLGEDGECSRDDRKGLMRLYGKDLPLDRRRLVAFIRDVSLISEEDYKKRSPPVRLSKFPDDLACRDLEYSGVYEDGWLSQHAYLCLARPSAETTLRIRGDARRLDEEYSTELCLSLDGKEALRKVLYSGPFEITLPVPAGTDRSRVDLTFSSAPVLGPKDRSRVLGRNDHRPAAAKLVEIEFARAASGTTIADRDQSLRR